MEAVKLAKEIGTKQATEELGIPKGILGGWVKKAKDGEIDTGIGSRSSEEALMLSFTQNTKNAKSRENP